MVIVWMPVLQVYGASMALTLDEGDIIISVKGSVFEPGDLVAFYMGNKILVKRCIAGPGKWVDIDADGNVYVDGELLDNRYFCMYDHRSISVDSRSTTVACASNEQIVGNILFRVRPLPDFGTLR
ncbi:MAG: S26 family signal peptidase [Acutalibacteraceae bacterium]